MQKQKNFRKLLQNPTLALTAVVALVLLFGSIVSLFHLRAYRQSEKQIFSEFQKEQFILSQTAATTVSHIFKFISRELKHFPAENQSVLENSRDLQTALKDLYETLTPRVRGVSRMNAQGILIGVYPPQKNVVGKNISQQPHVRKILAAHSPVISEPIQAVQGFEAVIIHIPIFKEKGKQKIFDGSIAALVPVKFLSEILKNYSQEKQDYHIFLVNERGTILTASNRQLIGQNIYKAAHISFPNTRNFFVNPASLSRLEHSALFAGSIVNHRELSILGEKWHLFLLTPSAHLKTLIHDVYFSQLRLWIISVIFLGFLGMVIFLHLYRWNFWLNRELETRTQEILTSEKRFKTLFTGAMEGIYQSTFDGKILQANPAMAKMLGYNSVEELLNQPASELYSNPLGRQKFLGKLQKEGVLQNMESRLRKKDGTEIIVLENARIIENPDGSLFYQGSIFDITERKHFEEQLRSNYIFSNRLLSYSQQITHIVELEEIFEEAVRSVTEYFSYPLAWLGTVKSPQSLSIQKVKGGSAPFTELLKRDCIESCLCPRLNKTLTQNELVVLEDIQTLDSCKEFREKALQLGYRSILYLPLSVKKEVFGILAIYQTVPNAFSGTELAHLQTFANLTSIAIEKAISVKTLRDSEKKYSQLVEQVPDGIILIEDGKFGFVNRRLAEILGYSVAELLGQPFEIAVSPQSLPLVASRYKKRMRGENVPSVYRILAVKKDGSEIPIELSTSRVTSGNKMMLLAIAHDLSDQEKTRKALHDSENRYRRLFENALLGITQFFSDGSLLTANRTWYKMLKYDDPNELLNVKLKSLFEYPKEYDKMIRQLEKEGIVTDFESRMKCRDGSTIVVQSNIRAEKDASGQVRFYEGIHQDISHRKQLEQELVQAQKMESIGILTGGIAHDFNNILTGIIGSANFIVEDLGPSHPSAEDAQQIVSLGERAAQLIRQLLTFSRKRSVERIEVDLNAMIKESLKMFERTFPENIHFRTRLEENLDFILANPEQVHQILLNLSINARDAMPHGGEIIFETRQITIDESYQAFHTHAAPGEYVQLSVTDTGSGIPEGILDKIFDPFFTTKKAGKGTGLGLSVVYGIVKNHNGFIHVYSEKNRGTTFKVYFPVVAESEKVQPANEASVAEMGYERILLVEDEEHVRRITRRILEGNGYSVVEAADGEDAFQVFETDTQGFDLIVSDVVMPRVGGIQLIEEILSQKPEQKFLFISGYSEGKLVVQGHSGPIDLVNKPFNSTELLEKVREILDRPAKTRQSEPTYGGISSHSS